MLPQFILVLEPSGNKRPRQLIIARGQQRFRVAEEHIKRVLCPPLPFVYIHDPLGLPPEALLPLLRVLQLLSPEHDPRVFRRAVTPFSIAQGIRHSDSAFLSLRSL